MDTFTSLITITLGLCIVGFTVIVLGVALYGILIWYPSYRKKKVDSLKTSGRQGRGTILRVPESIKYPHQTREGVFTLVNIGLEIDVPGIDVYQVDKTFTFPTGSLDLLEEGKEVAVWIDPNNPRDLSKIVMNVK